MINHISLAVNNPLHAAEVVAELWQGQTIPFPEHPGCYMALALDAAGTMIEFLPKGTILEPTADSVSIKVPDSYQGTAYTATHANIAVPVSEAQIYAIAEREGWRAIHCQRADFFGVIEFWLENEVLLELMPPTLLDQYQLTMHPENLKAISNA